MDTFKPGLYPHMSRAEYDAVDAMNISRLGEIDLTPAHFIYNCGHPKPPTDALEFGIVCHLATFEPEKLDAAVWVVDERHTPKLKTEARRRGVHLLKSEELALAKAMSDAVRRKTVARELLTAPGFAECAIVWKDELTGIMCKGRLDRICQWHQWSVVLDLKTTYSAAYHSFRWDAKKFHYHTKAAWYLDALHTLAPMDRRFVWLAVEKTAPHESALYEPDDADIAAGRENWRRWMLRYAECLNTNKWDGYPDGIEPMKLPIKENLSE